MSKATLSLHEKYQTTTEANPARSQASGEEMDSTQIAVSALFFVAIWGAAIWAILTRRKTSASSL